MSTGGAQLAIHFARALRAAQGDEPAKASAAIRDFTVSLTEQLRCQDPLVLRRDAGILRLGEEALVPAGPEEVAWFKGLRDSLVERGVAALIVSGSWDSGAVVALLAALCAGLGLPKEQFQAISGELSELAAPAIACALDDPGLLRYLNEPDHPELTARDRATFLYARLVALASHRSDRYDDALRGTLRGLVSGVDEPSFRRRLLAVTLRRSSEHAAAYAVANVSCLALVMARELGLSRAEQFDVAYAGLFHETSAAECLQRRNLDGTAALRVLVSVERREPELPEGLQAHPVASIVAVAEAFERSESGANGDPLTPCAAMTALSKNEALDPKAVALLRGALGTYPRGSVLRMSTGVVVVVDGADPPVIKGLVGPSIGELAVLDPDGVEDADVDPSEFGLKTWKIVLSDGTRPIVAPPRFSQPAANEETQLAARKFADALHKGIRAAQHHPAGTARRKQTTLGFKRALDGLRGASAFPLTLELHPSKVSVGEAPIVPRKKVEQFVTPLRNAGVRRLTFPDSTTPDQLEALSEAVAVSASEGDLIARLWEPELGDVGWHEHDPFGPAAATVERARSPLDEAFLETLTAVRAQLPAGLDDEDAFCDSAPRERPNPVAHDELLAAARDTKALSRAAQAALRARDQQPAAGERDVARFVGTSVTRALWREGLDPALDLMDALFDSKGNLPTPLVERLAKPEVIELLLRRLRDGGPHPDVGGGVAFLQPLGSDAVVPVCETYGTLHLDEPLRRLLATFLVDHIRDDPKPLIPLTLSRHPQIVREALILLGVGGVGSPGHTLLTEFSTDRSKPNRAARATVAQEILEEIGGSRPIPREELLSALCGSDKAKRLEAAARLKAGDEEAFTLLSTIVQEKEFSNRDDDEVQAMLDALSLVGGTRAVRVLEALNARDKAFSLITSGTRRVAKAASGRLKAIKSDVHTADTKRISKPKVNVHDAPTVRIKLDKQIPGGFASPTAGANVAPESVVAWLTCPLFTPVPLGPKPIVEIGRGTVDLKLIHESVSRRHAMIRVAGEQMTLEDRSSYGTWVNGERVLTSQLKVGDVITIGPFDVTLEASRPKASEAETRPLRTFASSEAIGGRLERVSLAEVLQQIEFNEKTGTLEVFTEDLNGTLVIYDGKPVYAEMGELRDNDAVLHMLQQKRGNFSFRAKIEAGEMTMSITLTGLLMEASRLIDEGSAEAAADG